MEMTVSKIKVSDLRQLISEVFDEKFSELIDPDSGLELRDEVKELLLQQEKRINEGERGISFEEMMAKLGIEEHELEISN